MRQRAGSALSQWGGRLAGTARPTVPPSHPPVPQREITARNLGGSPHRSAATRRYKVDVVFGAEKIVNHRHSPGIRKKSVIL